MAANTMDAIKKKMQSMKLEKEAALDKADQLEQKLAEQKEVNEKQEEEIQNLQKRISQLEGDLDQAQTQLEEATQKLENTEKQLNNRDRVPAGGDVIVPNMECNPRNVASRRPLPQSGCAISRQASLRPTSERGPHLYAGSFPSKQ
ncbi:hypothetical protein LSH36_104g03029 [Paralvinella palmiformis]|uniref:Tropomyosin n=1 Tax=Paralvinella palmiformis TaxID=53620 RepID=A0AAD9JZT2_9ANNE|nr:hypothetical protein LSH36_104g03029 [Paralvinella palmiformis]